MASTTSTPRLLSRSFAIGILLSMVAVFLLHYFGSWKVASVRPDPETTASVTVYNQCAVLGDVHVLQPSGASNAEFTNVDELKFAGSFMNFFDGHIVTMIIIALISGLIIFSLRRAVK